MFTCMRISEIGYYISLEQEAKQHKDRMSYYAHDDPIGQDAGRWWAPTPSGSSGDALVVRGDAVDVEALRRMSEGRHPRTDSLMIQKCRTERMIGWDLHLSAPKSVSSLWAASDEQVRIQINDIMRRATAKTMDTIHSMGLIESRIGKAGATRVPADQCAAGSWIHTTSRSGDPQLHVHSVLLNVCIRTDQSTGSLDNHAILNYQKFIGAAFDAELSSLLAQELDLPIECVAETMSFEVSGVPEAIRSAFSKRRAAIEDAAAAGGYDTANDRARAQLDSLRTRSAKSQLPEQAVLEVRWLREIRECGWSPETITISVREARLDQLLDVAHDDVVGQPHLADRAAAAAIAELSKTSSVLERRHVLAAVAGRIVGIGGIDTVLETVDRMIGDGRLIEIGRLGRNEEAVYATPATITLEADMLKAAVARCGEGRFVSEEEAEAAIDARVGITEEQAEAVRVALGDDGVVVLEGPPGSGKSFMAEPIAQAATAAGMKVYVTSTSWRATDVIREETRTSETAAKCIAAFLNRLDPMHKDHISLDAQTMVIVDEGSMIDLQSMAKLIAKANGARIIIVGDKLQLGAIGAGGPMEALASPSILGSQRLKCIRRQVDAWQREASVAFSSGDYIGGFESYDGHGCVHWVDGREAALDRLAADWADDLADHPQGQQLCLAYRHLDVRDINERCRRAYRVAGRLDGADVELRALGRGRRTAPAMIRLARGDRVIFGEGLDINGVHIRNSDLATVESITGDEVDPTVCFKLEKGPTVETRWSSFIGKRPDGCQPELRMPRIQHSYCISIHSSQGLTIGCGNPDKRVHGSTFVYSAGLGAQSTLVSMTRHVDTCNVYGETSRIKEKILSRKIARGIQVDHVCRLEAPDADEASSEISDAVSVEAIKAAVLKEVSKSESKINCMDYADNVHEWLAGREELGRGKCISNEMVVELRRNGTKKENTFLPSAAPGLDISHRRSWSLAAGPNV